MKQNHIVGKLYEVNKENMNKLIAEIEWLQLRNKELEKALEDIFGSSQFDEIYSIARTTLGVKNND